MRWPPRRILARAADTTNGRAQLLREAPKGTEDLETIMTREEIIEILVPACVNSGDTLTTARRRLWRMSMKTLQRELLLRGLADYDDPAPLDEEECDDCRAHTYSELGVQCVPIYAD